MKLVFIATLILISVQCRKVHTRGSRTNNQYDEKYDFIIVGNGISGSIVANRLSENYNWSILVLEPRRKPDLQSDNAYQSRNFDYNWNYPTEDPLYFVNSHKFEVPYIPSKLLNRDRITGNWDDAVEYFKNMDLSHEEELLNPYEYRTTEMMKKSKHKDIIRDAYKQEGIKYITGKNAAQFIGLSDTSSITLKDETRGLIAENPKTNLRFIYNAFVTSMDVDEKGFVQEVKYIQNNERTNILKAKARKEVILSAGSYITPKILMLSGLGPTRHLQELGIQSNCNLPVGQNLQDHAVIPYFLKVPCVTPERTGPVSQSGRLEFIALTNSRSMDRTYPDIMNTCRMVDCKDSPTMHLLLEDLPDEIKRIVLKELQDHSILVIGIHNIKPRSKGEIKLQSKDPFDPPIIKNNLFTSMVDVEAMIAGIRQQQQLLQSESFKKHHVQELTPYLRRCGDKKANSDSFWECYIQAVGSPFEDAIGTVKMGTEYDPTAVVDACFQVYRTNNLRVIDESVIPTILSGPTYQQAVRIGEKGAELIMKDYS